MWKPVKDLSNPTPVVVDEEGRPVAMFSVHSGEPADFAWQRACVASLAPEMHRKLSDLVIHASRHFPEVLNGEVKECLDLLNKYERYRNNE